MVCLALAGGVGGARMAQGLAQVLPPDDLLIAVNIGDDFTHLGLRVCPDLDTVMYTLAGIANPATGWGIKGETWNTMEALETLGGPAWFRLGDRDIATHLERTRRLDAGETLNRITHDLCARLGIAHRVVPASDTPVPTIVETPDGDLPFQDYFVRLQCAPRVTGFRFGGAESALPSAPLAEALDRGDIDCVILCPSNPFVSIDPILAIPAIGDFARARNVPVVAVSPIVGGRAVKGPAAKMMTELGVETTALAIADRYASFVDGLVIDAQDGAHSEKIRDAGMQVLVTDTVMKTDAIRAELAAETVEFARSIRD